MSNILFSRNLTIPTFSPQIHLTLLTLKRTRVGYNKTIMYISLTTYLQGSPESSAVSSKPTGTSTQTATSTQGASKKTNIGPIVGGAVGGVVGLLLLIGTVVTIIYVTRRRQKRAHTAASTSYLDTPQMGSTTQYDAASRFSHAPTTLQKVYVRRHLFIFCLTLTKMST